MQLCDIPRNSKILLPIGGEDNGEVVEKMCEFKHLDGMYSLIITPSGQAVHLGGLTEVKWVNDHYELGSENEPG